jgi:hypothetical protein
MVHIHNGSTVLLWHDMWGNGVRRVQSAELYSFTLRQHISLQQAFSMEDFHNIFHLPMSETAFQQFLTLQVEIGGLNINEENDIWSYIWGNADFSVKKAYNAISGSSQAHPVFNWLWSCKCQPSIMFSFGFCSITC